MGASLPTDADGDVREFPTLAVRQGDVLCLELAPMTPKDDHFVATVTALAENITHHIDEEEDEWFPKVREGLGRKRLQETGARMAELRPSAPTRPTEPKALRKALDAVRACMWPNADHDVDPERRGAVRVRRRWLRCARCG